MRFVNYLSRVTVLLFLTGLSVGVLAEEEVGTVARGNTLGFVEPNCPFVALSVVVNYPARLARIQYTPLKYTVYMGTNQPGAVTVQKPGGNVLLTAGDSVTVTLQQWEGLFIYNSNETPVHVAIYGPCP